MIDARDATRPSSGLGSCFQARALGQSRSVLCVWAETMRMEEGHLDGYLQLVAGVARKRLF